MRGDASFDLQDFQMVNHFYQHGFITSKIGLTFSLKRLPYWSNKLAMDNFYPKCFCVHRNDRLLKSTKHQNDQDDPMYQWDTFTDYFRVVWAESILKRYVLESKDIRVEKLLVALNIAEKRLLTADE